MTNAQENFVSRNGDERDQFIPVRKSTVLNALLEHGLIARVEAREQFGQLCKLLGAIFHYEYFEWLEKLRDDYYYFNPDISADHRLDPLMPLLSRTACAADQVTIDEPATDVRVRQVATDVRTNGKIYTNAGNGKTSEHTLRRGQFPVPRTAPAAGRPRLPVAPSANSIRPPCRRRSPVTRAELPTQQRLVVVQGHAPACNATHPDRT